MLFFLPFRLSINIFGFVICVRGENVIKEVECADLEVCVISVQNNSNASVFINTGIEAEAVMKVYAGHCSASHLTGPRACIIHQAYIFS